MIETPVKLIAVLETAFVDVAPESMLNPEKDSFAAAVVPPPPPPPPPLVLVLLPETLALKLVEFELCMTFPYVSLHLT